MTAKKGELFIFQKDFNQFFESIVQNTFMYRTKTMKKMTKKRWKDVQNKNL